MRKGKRDGRLIAAKRRKTKGVVESRESTDDEEAEDRSVRLPDEEEARPAIREKLSSSDVSSIVLAWNRTSHSVVLEKRQNTY